MAYVRNILEKNKIIGIDSNEKYLLINDGTFRVLYKNVTKILFIVQALKIMLVKRVWVIIKVLPTEALQPPKQGHATLQFRSSTTCPKQSLSQQVSPKWLRLPLQPA